MFDACSIDVRCIFDRCSIDFRGLGGSLEDDWGMTGWMWVDVGGCIWMWMYVDVYRCGGMWMYMDVGGPPEVWPGYAAVWGLCADLSEK